eukprot:c24921_g1_i3 orf=572-1594(-)
METMTTSSATLPITSINASTKNDPPWRQMPMTRRGIFAAVAYMACAVLLLMFNKAALSTYNFPCANIITLLQMVCSTFVLYTLRSWNIITFGTDSRTDLSLKGFVPFKIVLQTSPLSFTYLLYMVVGMASIRGVNVPMYTTLRRTTVFFTLIVEYIIAGHKHSVPVLGSVGLILLGAFIAGARDFSFDLQGYSIVILSNVTTAVYLATIARLGKTTGLSSFGLMWCNGLICGPALMLWAFASGDFDKAMHFPFLYSADFQVVVLFSCILAFCLNYTIFLNTTVNSPLTQTMCGNIKDIGTVLFGWLWFGGLPFDWLNVVGQFLGFLGSGLYAYGKLNGKL